MDKMKKITVFDTHDEVFEFLESDDSPIRIDVKAKDFLFEIGSDGSKVFNYSEYELSKFFERVFLESGIKAKFNVKINS